ncbi:16441_t:CDS:2 [Rhizophagus irregularis]|nr:16441_t:CDS:2 [Rhizophagus irregularis]
MKQQKKLDEYTKHEEVVQTDNSKKKYLDRQKFIVMGQMYQETKRPTKEELEGYDEVNTVCSTRLPENEEEKMFRKNVLRLLLAIRYMFIF